MKSLEFFSIQDPTEKSLDYLSSDELLQITRTGRASKNSGRKALRATAMLVIFSRHDTEQDIACQQELMASYYEDILDNHVPRLNELIRESMCSPTSDVAHKILGLQYLSKANHVPVSPASKQIIDDLADDTKSRLNAGDLRIVLPLLNKAQGETVIERALHLWNENASTSSFGLLAVLEKKLTDEDVAFILDTVCSPNIRSPLSENSYTMSSYMDRTIDNLDPFIARFTDVQINRIYSWVLERINIDESPCSRLDTVVKILSKIASRLTDTDIETLLPLVTKQFNGLSKSSQYISHETWMNAWTAVVKLSEKTSNPACIPTAFIIQTINATYDSGDSFIKESLSRPLDALIKLSPKLTTKQVNDILPCILQLVNHFEEAVNGSNFTIPTCQILNLLVHHLNQEPVEDILNIALTKFSSENIKRRIVGLVMLTALRTWLTKHQIDSILERLLAVLPNSSNAPWEGMTALNFFVGLALESTDISPIDSTLKLINSINAIVAEEFIGFYGDFTTDALARLAPKLTAEKIPQILEKLMPAPSSVASHELFNLLTALSPKLTEDQVTTILPLIVKQLNKGSVDCRSPSALKTLVALVPKLTALQRDEVLNFTLGKLIDNYLDNPFNMDEDQHNVGAILTALFDKITDKHAVLLKLSQRVNTHGNSDFRLFMVDMISELSMKFDVGHVLIVQPLHTRGKLLQLITSMWNDLQPCLATRSIPGPTIS